MSLGFEQPLYIFIAFISVPLFFIVRRFIKPLFALSLPLGPPGGIAFKPPLNLKYLMRLIHSLEGFGIFLLFAAAAGPNIVHTEMVWLNRGADILFVLDASPSMAGIDMGGRNRFDASRALLKDFAEQRPQDAIGLVAIGEDAALLVPLTTDRLTLYSRMDTLKIGEMGDGTAIGTGLAIAAFHISQSTAPRRAVVLITDGENNAGAVHPETAAAMLGEMSVSLWVIGVGSGGMVPIDYTDPLTGIRRTGTYDSRYDPESLRMLAESANGTWIHAPQSDAFAEAFSRLDNEEMVISRSGTIRREEALYGVFITAALALLLGLQVLRRFILGALL